MTDDSKPDELKDKNGKTVHSPNAPGLVEKVNPVTGGTAGAKDTHAAIEKPASR